MVDRSSRPNRILVIGLLIVGTLLVLYAIGRGDDDGTAYDPTSTKARGTSAMVELFESNGVEVDIIRGAPVEAGGIAIVLVDRFRTVEVDADQEFESEIGEVLAWVENGGTLIVADPSSALLTTSVAGPYRRGLECEIEALDSVDELGLESDDSDGFGAIEAVAFSATGSVPKCFFDQPGQAGVVADDLGEGVLVAFGFRELLTNSRIGDADHAMLAVSLLAPEPGETLRIIDGPSLLANGEETLSDLVPSRLKWALALAAFAFFVYAVGRSIRHGNPVLEPMAVEISGSELVEATGAMLGRARQSRGAGEALRSVARQDLAIAVGLPRHTDATAVAAVLTERFEGIDGAHAQNVLNGPPVASDDELLALANTINQLRDAVLGAKTAPSEPTDRTRTLTQ